jgi:general secretion pathway protein K
MKNPNFNPDPKKRTDQKGELDFMVRYNLAAFAQRVTLGLLPQKETRIGVNILRASLGNERGVALVIVLWIFIFLFVAAFDFSISVREEGMVTRRYAEEAEGYYLALGGFQERLYRLLSTQKTSAEARELGDSLEDEKAIVYGEWYEAALGNGFYRVRVVDEGGKVNLNRADERSLRQVFTNLGIGEPRLGVLVDSILDWRDEDQLHRVNGAEDDYYLSLPNPYPARNGPFDTPEDLLWVKGVTSALFYGLEEDGVRRVALKDIFTVDTRANRINLRTASAEVCHALVGIPLEECQQFVEERKNLTEKTLVDMLGLLGLGSGEERPTGFVFVNPTVVSVEAQGFRSQSAIPSRIRGVVRLLDGGRSFEIVRWVDREPWMSYRRAG